jgi:hypothetical protein
MTIHRTNDGDISSLNIAKMQGRLEVYQHILKMLRMSELSKHKMIKKMEEVEQQQDLNREFL